MSESVARTGSPVRLTPMPRWRHGEDTPRMALVGGGPSSACLVIRLAERLARGAAVPVPLEIVLVDRTAQVGGGDPHALGISPALLLNDELMEIDSTGLGFTEWLLERDRAWLSRLSADPDPRVRRWLRRNSGSIALGELGGLFLPRALFGDFIRERFVQARRELARRGVSVTVVAGQVTQIRPAGHGLWDLITGQQALRAHAVLLAVGSLCPPPPAAVAGHPRFFSYERARDIARMESEVGLLLARSRPDDRRLVVLGSATAACEVLYCLEDCPGVGPECEVLVVSRSGRLPDGLPSGKPVPFACSHLPRLVSTWRAGDGAAAEPTSAAVIEALVRDVAAGRSAGYTIVDILRSVTPAFAQAFRAVPPDQKRLFVEQHFWTYREAVRHTSTDYGAALARLRQGTRLTVRRGVVTAVERQAHGQLEVHVQQEAATCVVPAAAVFDCRGFVGVHETANPVVTDLLATRTASANPCGRGLRVNEHFEAAPGLFVLGPVLAGTSQGHDHIWSLENIPRIYTLAERIAAAACERLGSHPVTRTGRASS